MGSHDGSVHHQPLVGVDTDTEETGIGVDLENLVTGSQVVEDTSLVQDGQVGHVFLLLELGGIAFQNLGLGKADALLLRKRRRGNCYTYNIMRQSRKSCVKRAPRYTKQLMG